MALLKIELDFEESMVEFDRVTSVAELSEIESIYGLLFILKFVY